jgi:hypothetical protein
VRTDAVEVGFDASNGGGFYHSRFGQNDRLAL